MQGRFQVVGPRVFFAWVCAVVIRVCAAVVWACALIAWPGAFIVIVIVVIIIRGGNVRPCPCAVFIGSPHFTVYQNGDGCAVAYRLGL